eukprot:scaffold2011_cov142-Skeletonema_menzelii.AAC.9
MVVPRFKFLNLIVVLAAPRACFIMEKLRTLYGSPSSSMVNPFLMSDVSTATFRADDERWVKKMVGAKATDVPTKDAKMASFIIIVAVYYTNNDAIDATIKCCSLFFMRSNGMEWMDAKLTTSRMHLFTPRLCSSSSVA